MCCHAEGMAIRADLKALQSMLEQASILLSSEPMIPGGHRRCRELVDSALGLSRVLVSSNHARPVAAALGRKGGRKTAERGPEHFARIAGMRKTHGGGRPRKQAG